MKREILAVRRCLDFICRHMLTGNNGKHGMYERFMTDTKERSVCVRPDCNAEAARVLWKLRQSGETDDLAMLYENIVEWLLKAQRKGGDGLPVGTFPFYLVDGIGCDESLSNYLYQNDNGKVLVAMADLYNLAGDKRMEEPMRLAADFWTQLQQPDGVFYRQGVPGLQAACKGPVFSIWLALGLLLCGEYFHVPAYTEAARRSFARLDTMLLDTGRIQTTYEVEGGEAWRPASSESAIALYCYTRAYELTKDREYFRKASQLAEFLRGLQSYQGGIVNCNTACLEASQQNNEDLCDLVYTQGYALMGLARFARLEDSYGECVRRLADFLMDIQCQGESSLWDGAWRGAYIISEKRWSGRADQGGNLLDEGGMYAIYTGWCCMPIAEGLLDTLGLAGGKRQ